MPFVPAVDGQDRQSQHSISNHRGRNRELRANQLPRDSFRERSFEIIPRPTPRSTKASSITLWYEYTPTSAVDIKVGETAPTEGEFQQPAFAPPIPDKAWWLDPQVGQAVAAVLAALAANSTTRTDRRGRRHSHFSWVSGHRTDSGTFPHGVDPDLSMARRAETLHDVLRMLFPRSAVQLFQAWSKSEIFDRIVRSVRPVGKLHVLAHGDHTHLSLAHAFAGGRRLLERARHFNRLVMPDFARAVASLEDEDALVQGYLTHSLSTVAVGALRDCHVPNAHWQLWPIAETRNGSGSAITSTLRAHPELKHYLDGLAHAEHGIGSLAQEIAMKVHVFATVSPVRAAPLLSAPADAPQRGEPWIPYAPGTGVASAATLVCGLPHRRAEVAQGRLPAAFANLYLVGHGRRAPISSVAR